MQLFSMHCTTGCIDGIRNVEVIVRSLSGGESNGKGQEDGDGAICKVMMIDLY